MAKSKRSPMVAELIKGLIFLGFGVILIVQPWLSAVSWLGWLILVLGALIACVMGARILGARRMQRHVVAQFSSGNAVYDRGLKIDGILYDFSTFGAEICGATFDGERLSILYSYYAKRRGRAMEEVGFNVEGDEADKALKVIQHLGVPPVEEARAREQARQDALEAERSRAALERKDR